MHETLDTIGYDLAGARTLIEMTRQALQAAPQGIPEFEKAIARLERIEAEVARVDGWWPGRRSRLIEAW